MFLLFYLTHCCHTSVTISDTTWEEEVFLFSKESQQIWELEDQENQSLSDNFNLVTVQSALKEQSGTQSEFSYSIELKRQFNIQSAHKEQLSPQLVQKEQSDALIIQKEQSSSLGAQREQSDIQLNLKEKSPSYILQVIQKGYLFKIKYCSSVSRWTSTERRAH